MNNGGRSSSYLPAAPGPQVSVDPGLELEAQKSPGLGTTDISAHFGPMLEKIRAMPDSPVKDKLLKRVATAAHMARAERYKLKDPQRVASDWTDQPQQGGDQGMARGLLGMDPTKRISSGSRTVRPSKVTKEDIARRIDENTWAQGGREAAADEKMQSLASDKSAISSRLKELGITSTKAADRAHDLKIRHDNLADQEAVLKDKLGRMKVDPDRLMNNMPTVQRAVAIIGAGLARLGGDGAGFKMIDAAIDRDIRAQRANIHNAMQNYNLTAAQERQMWQRWSQMEGEHKSALREMVGLRLARNKIEREGANLSSDLLKEQQAEARGVEEMRIASRPDVSRTSGYQTIIDPKWKMMAQMATAGKGGRKLTAQDKKYRYEVGQKMSGMETTAKEMQSLLKNQQKLGGRWSAHAQKWLGGLTGGLLASQAHATDAERNAIMAPIIKMYFGGHASDQDRKYIDGIMLKVADTRTAKLQKLELWKARGYMSAKKAIDSAYNAGSISKQEQQRAIQRAKWVSDFNHRHTRKILLRGGTL